MLDCLKFLLEQAINIIKILFNLNVGFTNLGTVFCIVFILFPIMLAIIQFIKTSFVEEIDEGFDSGSLSFGSGYVGQHEYVGKHSKEYKQRIKRGQKLGVYYGKHERRYK